LARRQKMNYSEVNNCFSPCCHAQVLKSAPFSKNALFCCSQAFQYSLEPTPVSSVIILICKKTLTNIIMHSYRTETYTMMRQATYKHTPAAPHWINSECCKILYCST
jgi:hypothetical protein